MVQVEVVTHFNEDAFSYGVAQGMAERLRAALRDVRCSDHEENASVRIGTEGIAQTFNDLQIDVSGCCTAVVERVEAVITEIQSDEAYPARPGGE